MFLQSYVVPICLFESVRGSAIIRKLFGTSFLIGASGVLVTARHVIEAATSEAATTGLTLGVIGKSEGGQGADSVASSILAFEFAPEPFDVAIAVANYKSPSRLTFSPREVTEWTEVATMGYPIHGVSGPPAGLNLNLRCHKGYIQRKLRPGDLHIGRHPDSFELSFLIGKGISGAPLFIRAEPADIVIGICVGSARSEVIEDEYVEVQSDGTKYKELKLKIEEFGIAHDASALLSWRPSMLGGPSLHELSRG